MAKLRLSPEQTERFVALQSALRQHFFAPSLNKLELHLKLSKKTLSRYADVGEIGYAATPSTLDNICDNLINFYEMSDEMFRTLPQQFGIAQMLYDAWQSQAQRSLTSACEWVTLLSSGTVPPNFPKEQREDLENLLQARTSAFSWLSLVLAHFFIKAVGNFEGKENEIPQLIQALEALDTHLSNHYPRRGGFRKPNPKRFNPGKQRIDYKEEAYDPNQPIRLNKFLANAGVCSRRDADKYIQAGVVSVNGEIITELGHKVLRTDTILFHDQQVKAEKKIYVLLNKPKGYVTTSEDPQNRKTVMDLVRNACMERIYPVGRLDRNTTGVLLLTNDGEMASKLTHPKFMKKKIYHVYLDRNVTAADLRQIAEGVTLEDGDIRADAVDYASETDRKQVGIEIHSGKNRIVRRIFAALGYNVIKLDRVYFAGLTKKNVKRGDWRFLTEEEVRMLRMGSFE